MRYRYEKHPSKISTLMITTGAGSRVEYKTPHYGIAHLMEHMRFKGTRTTTAKELLKQISALGGQYNAFTSEDLCSYHVQVPEENIEGAFKFLQEVIFNPIFPQDELEKEKIVICQEIQMYNDDIDSLVHDKLIDTVYNNALAFRVIGNKKSVMSVSRDDLIRFNNEFYANKHLLISLAGNTDHQPLVEQYFGPVDDVLSFKTPDIRTKYKPKAFHRVVKEGQLQDSIKVCFGSQDILSFARAYNSVYSVFNSIFGSGSASRLFLSVREDLGLVYTIGSYLDYNLDGATFQIHTSTEPKNTDQVLEEIGKQIDLISQEPPTEDEMNCARNEIKSRIYSKLDTSFGVAANKLAEEFYGFKTGLEFLDLTNNITADEIHNLSRLIFLGTRYTIIGTGVENA